MNQVKFKVGLQMFINQFYEINYISQTVYWIELKVFKNILDT